MSMRPEEIKEAFALFDPQNTGTIQPQAFQGFLDASVPFFSSYPLDSPLRFYRFLILPLHFHASKVP